MASFNNFDERREQSVLNFAQVPPPSSSSSAVRSPPQQMRRTSHAIFGGHQIMAECGGPPGLNFNHVSDGIFHLKILIPSLAAGGIIGKGGEKISELQKETGVKMKLSKANEFYPGTTERVCLLTGSLEGISVILIHVQMKIREKPDPNARLAMDFDNKVCAERERQIKFIVPNSTAGMIIGKGGSLIRFIKEESGAFIQLSQKAKESSLPERVVTLIGETENLMKAMDIILRKIREDPQSGSCLTINYSEVQGLVANFNPTGSPFAGGPSPTSSGGAKDPSSSGLLKSLIETFPSRTSPKKDETPGGLNIPMNSGVLNLQLSLDEYRKRKRLDGSILLSIIQPPMISKGYTPDQIVEITQALSVLSTHNLLDINFIEESPPVQTTLVTHINPPTASVQPHQDPIWETALRHLPEVVTPRNQNSFGLRPHTGLLDESASTPPWNQSDIIHNGLPEASEIVLNNNGLPSSGSTNGGQMLQDEINGSPSSSFQDKIAVHENIIGAVIGPSGRHIADIQNLSGAKIQVSKKGSFTPGTRKRIVSLCGAPNSISVAKRMIDERIKEEEDKRELERAIVNQGTTTALPFTAPEM